MCAKKDNRVPTVGTANIGRQKNFDVEGSEELAPYDREATKLRNKEKTKNKNKK